MIFPKILIVDDEEEFSASVKDLLIQRNYRVTTCSSIENAILSLENNYFDIVICDVFMPFFGTSEGGIEVAKLVSVKHPSSWTIIVSQFVTEKLVNNLLEVIPKKQYYFLNKDGDFNNKLLKLIEKGLSQKQIFVLMPFHEQFDNIYLFGIKSTVEELNYKCYRVDEIQYVGGIIEKIYEMIQSSHVIIADMTNRNPNVFYEVGYAHALNKQVILLINDANDIPVDLKNYVHIIYNKNNIQKLKDDLRKKIESILA